MNKVYDGTTSATVTLSDNCVAGDVFTDNYTSDVRRERKHGQVCDRRISISGTDAGNYTANTTATTTANITPQQTNVTAIQRRLRRDGVRDLDTALNRLQPSRSAREMSPPPRDVLYP